MKKFTDYLYPHIEPYHSFFLKVDEQHEIYIEECGNENGKPILFLHGGPGSGLANYYRRFFDPEFYRIILFDQRGAGNSRPSCLVENNTTWDLISDIEKIRNQLEIKSWIVFGGSWGSTLALRYAQEHPDFVKGLIVRGIFLGRPQDINWFYESGANNIYPDEFENYIRPIKSKLPEKSIVTAHYENMFKGDEESRRASVIAWTRLENNLLTINGPKDNARGLDKDNDEYEQVKNCGLIECHYFYHQCFMDEETSILKNSKKIEHIPITIIHGRYDVICSFNQAWELHQHLPSSELVIVQNAGHSAKEPDLTKALVKATEKYKSLF